MKLKSFTKEEQNKLNNIIQLGMEADNYLNSYFKRIKREEKKHLNTIKHFKEKKMGRISNAPIEDDAEGPGEGRRNAPIDLTDEATETPKKKKKDINLIEYINKLPKNHLVHKQFKKIRLFISGTDEKIKKQEYTEKAWDNRCKVRCIISQKGS